MTKVVTQLICGYFNGLKDLLVTNFKSIYEKARNTFSRGRSNNAESK